MLVISMQCSVYSNQFTVISLQWLVGRKLRCLELNLKLNLKMKYFSLTTERTGDNMQYALCCML